LWAALAASSLKEVEVSVAEKGANMKLKHWTWGLAIGSMAFLGAGIAARAQQYPAQESQPRQSTRTSTMPQTNSTNMMSDEMFAKKAAQANLAEVKLGELAEQKGGTQQVRNFGQRMVTDHTKAGNQLKNVAQKESIKLPDRLDAKDQATYDRLSKLSGKKFDEAYARDMLKNHRQDVKAFKQEANTGVNSAIRSYASETVPTLEEHLRLAGQMMQSVSGGEARSGSLR
jgi:putative membrane protein